MTLRQIKTRMTVVAMFALLMAVHADIFGSGTHAFVMDFAAIGDAENPAQSYANRDHSQSGGDGLGAVAYAYSIGTYQVTIDQFTKADAESGNTIGDGDEAYWLASRGSNAPAVYVSFFEAARFCNWLSSGNATNGAYLFDGGGAFTGIDRTAALTTFGTVYVLPERNEWHKAAYYNTDTDKYTLYAFGINTAPLAGVDAIYNSTPSAAVWAVGSGNVEQNGTYDMMGNVWEWCEQLRNAGERRLLGGNYQLNETYMESDYSTYGFEDSEDYRRGFRVVRLQEAHEPYEAWAGSYGLAGGDALPEADVEPDGLNNLTEYALGGNPTNDDASAVLPVGFLGGDGGGQYLRYACTRRTDDDDLIYRLATKTNLVGDFVWNPYDVTFVGESTESGGFKTVTNQTEVAGDSKFIRMECIFRSGLPRHAQWSDYLYPSSYLDGESHCPPGHLKIYVSTNGVNSSTNINNPNTPIQTLYFAKYLIDAIEAYDEAHGLNRWPGYCILLKRGETFVPYNYFTLQASKNECVNDEYNRVAFYWNINKPLFITSYGSSGSRPRIDGQTGWISKVNSYGEANTTVRIQFPFMICQPPEIGEPGIFWNQNTVIENLHLSNWELSAIWNYKNNTCDIRNNIIEKIGTYYFLGEEYLIAGSAQKVDGGPYVDRWPIYAGAAIYAHRCANISIHNNVLVDIHNLDKNDFPLVDKLHSIYTLAAQHIDIQNNCIQRVSGAPLVIRLNANDIHIADNRLEDAAPATDVTQYWSGTYVQQGFVRIPATDGIVPYDVVITNNEFFFPYFWDIELGRSSDCTGQDALERSGQFFDGPMADFLMTNNTFLLEWDPSW